jgi:hypothetical protein
MRIFRKLTINDVKVLLIQCDRSHSKNMRQMEHKHNKSDMMSYMFYSLILKLTIWYHLISYDIKLF